MSPDATRATGFLAVTIALGLVVGAFGTRFLEATGGAQGELVTRLKKLERDGVEVEFPGATLLAQKVSFQRISVTLEADGRAALVTSTLDLTGELRRKEIGRTTTVSSLGLERARYVYKDNEWVPETSDTPRLHAILVALERRRRQLEVDPDPDAGVEWGDVRNRTFRSLAWYLRSEREEVLVTEDYRLQGETPERPVDEKGSRRLTLIESPAGSFSFPGGIL